MIKAVLFDCDGVLVNSEQYHQGVDKDFIEAYGLQMDPREFRIMIGSSRQMNLLPRLYEKAGTDWTLEEFTSRLFAYKAARMKGLDFSDIMFPDVPEALSRLKHQGYRIACASSSSKDYLNRVLSQCHISHYFDLVVTGLDFERSKPAPDIYLFCAQAFGLLPEECLVIEDSPFGIAAAIAAGMPVLARRDRLFDLDQSKATAVIDDLSEMWKAYLC